MENPLIQKLREDLALSAGHRSEKHPNAEAVVITSQASVKAALDELDELRRLKESAQKLNEIVEGVRAERWAADGRRLKDTPEWCGFYVALPKG